MQPSLLGLCLDCLVCEWVGTVGHQFDGWGKSGQGWHGIPHSMMAGGGDGWGKSDQGWHESSQHTMTDGGKGPVVAGFACAVLVLSVQ